MSVKLNEAMPDLQSFNRRMVDANYLMMKDYKGRKVVINPPGKEAIIVTFNQLLDHLDRLAKSDKENKQGILNAVDSVMQLKNRGKVNLLKAKKGMTLCQKIDMAFRQFFGNFGKLSHLKKLAQVYKSSFPIQKMNGETLKLKGEIDSLFATSVAKRLLPFISLESTDNEIDQKLEEFAATHLVEVQEFAVKVSEIKPKVKSLSQSDFQQTKALYHHLGNQKTAILMRLLPSARSLELRLDLMLNTSLASREYAKIVKKEINEVVGQP